MTSRAVRPTPSEELVRLATAPAAGPTRRLGALVDVGLYAASFAGALLLASSLVLLATDASPGDVVSALYRGSLEDGAALGLTLQEATPILVIAVGVVIATRAGTFTLGPEGQFLVGGLASGWVLLRYGLPAPVAVPLSLVSATLAGALWAALAAVLRHWRGVDVVISTLLLNFVAAEVVSFALNRTWLLQEVVDRDVLPAQSARVAEADRLPTLGSMPGFATTSGVLLAAVLVGLAWFALSRTRWGFEIRVLGLNPRAARAVGASMALLGGGALVLSGALAGLAGGVWLTGIGQRLVPGFVGTIGGEGLLAALIARRSVVAAVPIALFFGVLRAGGGFLAATGVPSTIVDVVQALVVLAALLPPAVLHVWRRRQSLRVARLAARSGSEGLALGGAAA